MSRLRSIAMNATRWSASVIRPSRRDFLKLVTSYLVGISGALGLAGIGRYLSYDGGPPRKTEFDLGPAEFVRRRIAHARRRDTGAHPAGRAGFQRPQPAVHASRLYGRGCPPRISVPLPRIGVRCRRYGRTRAGQAAIAASSGRGRRPWQPDRAYELNERRTNGLHPRIAANLCRQA